MIKKYSVLTAILIAVLLLFIATLVYPGGSLSDKNSIGFQWSKNFISNLFGEKAVNGAVNPSRTWADAGMILLSAGFAIFFSNFAKKIPSQTAAKIIKYLGAAGMLCTILIVTALHDIMVNISSTLFLVSMFYITVFIVKSQLHLLKFICIIGLIIFYYTLYLYGARKIDFLPVMQKITFGASIIQVLCLEYFTKKEDFEPPPSQQ
jgi:hypothetical protein